MQAEEVEVGTCWLCWFNEKDVEKVPGLRKSTKIDIMISMGYPAKVSERGKRKKSLNEIRRFYK